MTELEYGFRSCKHCRLERAGSDLVPGFDPVTNVLSIVKL